MSTQTFGAAPSRIAVHNLNCTPLYYRCLLIRDPTPSLICTEDCTMQRKSPRVRKRTNIRHEPKNRLDVRDASAHRAHSGQAVMSDLVAYVDGGSLGNPGPSGIGVVINGCESGEIRIAKWIGHQDNNVAEYAALMEALQCALSLNATKLHVYSDSEVMVRQMRGEDTCRSPPRYPLHCTFRNPPHPPTFPFPPPPRHNHPNTNPPAP